MSEQNSPLILGNERIGKLLIQYALPAIVAMTASSIYNMVDSIFIGHGVGALAIAGLALTSHFILKRASLPSTVIRQKSGTVPLTFFCLSSSKRAL